MWHFTRLGSIAAATLALALGGVAGCSSSSDTSTTNGTAGPCQPLAPVTSAVTLQASDIIDAGRDADGTVYVFLSSFQVYVSSAGVLIEKTEYGGGGQTVGGTQTWVSSYLDDAGATVTVEVQSDDAGLHMGVVKGPISGKTFDVGSEGSVLEPIAAVVAAAMPAKAIQTFHVEFAGVESDGITNLVVTAPDHVVGDFEGFRVFIGPVSALSEQAGPVIVGRSSDTDVAFMSNGAEVSISYGVYGVEGTGFLTIGTDTEQLTGVVHPVAPDGAIFICR